MRRVPYVGPVLRGTAFNCIRCGAYAKQGWTSLYGSAPGGLKPIDEFYRTHCAHCGEFCYWYEGRMVIPDIAAVEQPHPDLPEDCVAEFEEAEACSIAPPGQQARCCASASRS